MNTYFVFRESQRKCSAINLFVVVGDEQEIGDGRFSPHISTMVDEGAPARGSSRPRRLGAPVASGESAFQPPLRDYAAGCASREWFFIMRVAVCDLDVRIALVELDAIAHMFEPRAGGRPRCEVMLSPPAASALDARIRR